MKLTELFNLDDTKQKAFLLGGLYAWPILTEDKKYIFVYSGYKIGKRMKGSINDLNSYYGQHLEKLKSFLINRAYSLDLNTAIRENYVIEKAKRMIAGVSVIFENDFKEKSIYGAIEKCLVDMSEEHKDWFLIGLMESRGSLDFDANFYTIDIAKKNPKLVRRKMNRLQDILRDYNYNPRVIQEKSHDKNDQFRIDLDYYAMNYGFFRPHIIEYYKKEKNEGFIEKNTLWKIEKRDIKRKPNRNKNRIHALDDLAIELEGLEKEKRRERIEEFKKQSKDYDTIDEIKLSSVSLREQAKIKSNFLCQYDKNHVTFKARSTGKNYVESHHLIPFSKREHFDVSIDIEENIITLCPNCHRCIHHGIEAEQKKMINVLFDETRKASLKEASIDIAKFELYKMYNIKI